MGYHGDVPSKHAENDSPASGASPARVLLAEDDVDVQRNLALLLGGASVGLEFAADGRIACDMAAKSQREGRPFDLILMDLQMPIMDGVQATKALRERGWSNPILVVTAEATEERRRRCDEVGCDDCLARPLTREVLQGVFERYLAPGSFVDLRGAEPGAAARAAIGLVRRINYVNPWKQLNPSLAKRVERWVPRHHGPRRYDAIQGEFEMQLELASHMERHIFLGSYEMSGLRMLQRVLRRGDVFVDGGANLGLFALVASRRVGPTGKVHAFEPQPGLLPRLREHVRRNADDRIEIHPLACWDEQATLTFYEFDRDNVGIASLMARDNVPVKREVRVEAQRIDAVVEPPVRLIKLDVEGAEWRALHGAEKLLFGSQPADLMVELNPLSGTDDEPGPLELVDWMLGRRPNDRLFLLNDRRRVAIDRDRLAARVEHEPTKCHNVYFQSTVNR